MRMLAAFAGVGVWLVGSADQAAQDLLRVTLSVNLQAGES